MHHTISSEIKNAGIPTVSCVSMVDSLKQANKNAARKATVLYARVCVHIKIHKKYHAYPHMIRAYGRLYNIATVSSPKVGCKILMRYNNYERDTIL